MESYLSRTEVEKRWLEYARDVLSRDGGPTNCCVGGDTATLSRWPGYLGTNYASGRVLFVGAVHNQDVLHTTPAAGFIAAAASEWINGKRSDADYLALLRAEYPKAIQIWSHSGVFSKFAFLRNELGISPEQCAITNIAKCAAVPGDDKYTKSISQCPLRFPLADLIGRLDPVLVLIACNSCNARLPGISSSSERRMYRFQQMTWTEFATGRKLSRWLPEAVEFYREQIQRSGELRLVRSSSSSSEPIRLI